SNTSAVAVTITSLTDAWPGQAPFSPTCVTQIVGTTLAPGQSATCAFTLNSYAPTAGGSVTNTATVIGCQQGVSGNCATVPGTSTVLSPPVFASAGGLAFTGPPAHLQLMLELGFSMVSIGSFLLWFTRPRRVRTERS
ncbi:MAG TPA: hypothetical protein VE991_01985, partial [Acidimicrobiales bacterium]|nr:hypothetical protein [Acidimicrobiales bacterium]